MSCHWLTGVSVAVALCLSSSLARAQCTMDTECKGDRVCEEGKCVAPAAVSPPAPSAAARPAAPPVSAPPAAPVAALPPAPAPTPEKPEMRRHSTGMMVGGIVMTSMAPLALFTAAIYGLANAVCDHDCEAYETTAKLSLISAVVLAGVGIPMIVVGAEKVPVESGSATARIGPWATPHAAGLGFRLDL